MTFEVSLRKSNLGQKNISFMRSHLSHLFHQHILRQKKKNNREKHVYETVYSRMEQAKFVEDGL